MAKGMHIRKDDSVILIAGKDKGKTGRVLRTEPGRRRVYVEGLNIVKRHTKPRSVKDTQKAQSSGIIEQEGPIDVSNVMLLDPTDNKPTRVGVRVGDDGTPPSLREADRQGDRVETPDGSGNSHRHTAGGAAAASARALPVRSRRAADRAVRLHEPDAGPTLDKITLNMGVGDAKQATPVLEAATEQLGRSPASARTCAARASRSPRSRSARGCRSVSR